MTLEELLPDQALRLEIEREIHDLAAAGAASSSAAAPR